MNIFVLTQQGDSGNVWGASLNGTVMEWDARTHLLRRTINISDLVGRKCSVVKLLLVDGNIWCDLPQCPFCEAVLHTRGAHCRC